MLDHISLEDRWSLARTDCTLAPSPVNYTGPGCHLNVHGNFSDHGKVEAQGRLFSENHSACLTSCLRPEQWNGAQSELTGKQKGTNWHQGRRVPGTEQGCDDQRLHYHLLGAEWKILLACGLDLPATGDNDIKYKLVFKLFKSGNCTWFACPTEELWVNSELLAFSCCCCCLSIKFSDAMCAKQDTTVGDEETWALSWNCVNSSSFWEKLTSFTRYPGNHEEW